ncbi:uncharacterized protein LOC124811594 isoform X1 [Hydra vulgaris]|nr:uncharacterized bolA-like protein C4B3.11c isoform X1 [Hydra vulgaris]
MLAILKTAKSKILIPPVVLKNAFAAQRTYNQGEIDLENILRKNLDVKEIEVQDISGGCGSMYQIFICANEFRGKRMVQQHRIVTDVLKEQVKNMHGLRITTAVPTD